MRGKGIVGLRKFIVVLLILGLATLMLWLGKITGDNYVSLITWVTGLYFGANSLSSVGGKLAEKKTVEVNTVEVKTS